MKQARPDEDNGHDRFSWEESYLESKSVCSKSLCCWAVGLIEWDSVTAVRGKGQSETSEVERDANVRV